MPFVCISAAVFRRSFSRCLRVIPLSAFLLPMHIGSCCQSKRLLGNAGDIKFSDAVSNAGTFGYGSLVLLGGNYELTGSWTSEWRA